MEQLEKLGAWLKARLREPSSWIAIGTLIVTYKLMDAQTWAMWFAVIGALAGFGLRESGSQPPAPPPAPQPANEAAKAEAPAAPAAGEGQSS
jgi:hypothetical protein